MLDKDTVIYTNFIIDVILEHEPNFNFFEFVTRNNVYGNSLTINTVLKRINFNAREKDAIISKYKHTPW